MRVLRLPQNPHQLCHRGLQRHIVCLQETEFLFDGTPDLVDRHVAALIGYLSGHDDGLAERNPFLDGFVKIPAVIGGKSAYTKGLDDDGVIMARHVIQHIGAHGRDQFQQGDIGIQRAIKLNMVR